MTSGYSGGACSSFGQVGPEPQELQHRALAEFEGLQIRWPPRGTGDPETGSLKLDNAYRPARRSQSASGEALGPWGGPGGAVPIIQAVPQGAEPPRPLFQARHPRFPTQKEAATVACPAAGPQSSPTDCQHRVPETGTASVRLPSLPDDEVFLEEAPPVRTRSPLDSSVRPGLPASPEPPLDLLEGLIPLAEVWAAMRPACGKTGEEAAGTSEPGCTQLLPTSQEETRFESPTTHTMPDQPCGRGLPEPNSSIQAKKVELADLLQKALQNLQAEQEQLQGAAQTWARRRAALEASVGKACAPRDLERFSRFMADLERVLGLLLLLGSRLARVHRALARTGADIDPDEQASLLQRLRLLQRQQEDAGELKEHVARRERALREVLVQALPAGDLRAYCALLASKAAVLAQQRSLDERVRLLQDQLDAVRSSLAHRPSSPRLASPPGTQPPHKPPFPALLI
ncbi:shroom family member 1 [Phyllostomus discolor]|uniref:Shroom family member 1 n=1 Tax=Phyllostomus discolor TaxID=89673 RepID=A0A833YY02_9CHIR|nr:shroom family member 1 [Phyllostomus discolor]